MNKKEKIRTYFITCLILLSFLLNGLSGYFISYQKNIDYFYNGLKRDDVIYLNLDSNKIINWREIARGIKCTVMSEINISIKSVKSSNVKSANVKGIYINDGMYLPLDSGRSFYNEDFYSFSKRAIIGSNFKDDIYQKNKKNYIKIVGIEYEVIGVFSDYGKFLNNIIMINLDSFENDIIGSSNKIYLLDGKDNAKLYNKMANDLKGNLKAINKISMDNSSIGNFIKVDSYAEFLSIFISFVIQMFIFIASIYLLQSKRDEISLKLNIGINKNVIYKENLNKLIKIIIHCFVIVSIFFNIITFFTIRSYLLNFNLLYLKNSLLSLLLFFLFFYISFYKYILKKIKGEI